VADARRAEGEALLALGQAADGEALLRRAKAEAGGLGAAPPGWRACLALAQLFEAAGRATEAMAERQQALVLVEQVANGLADAPELRRAFEASEPFRAARGEAPLG
jgi:hypothetical protein